MASKPERRAGDDHLPHELWREIVNRLPVKSILRFRSVCKSWYSLVSCPNFINNYKNGSRLLLQVYKDRFDDWNDACSYSSHDESFMESREHEDFPEPFRGAILEIVGSCNGLICLSKYDDERRVNDYDANVFITITLLIWNPSIRKVVEVSSLTFWSEIECPYKLGFGFDSKTSNYKVMCMYRCNKYVLDPNVWEIFDLRKGVWRIIRPLIPSWNFEDTRRPECYLDGAVHWTGHAPGRENYHRILLSFNMSDEVFQEIRLPDFVGFIKDYNHCIETHNWMDIQFVTFGGLIHFIALKYEDGDNVFYEQGECSIWAMKEYGVTESWTKLFNINMQSARLHPRAEILDHIWLWRNGEIWLWRNVQDLNAPDYKVSELLSYDNESWKCNRIFSIPKHLKDVCLFEESLVLM